MKLNYEDSIFSGLGKEELTRKFMPNGTFVDGYVEAMFFTESGEDHDSIESGLGVFDFSRETAIRILEDCRYFESALDEKAEELDIQTHEIDYHQAGIDFWFTRNHHGCGFWDGDWDWNPELAKFLDDLSKEFGDVDVETGDDKQIHLM